MAAGESADSHLLEEHIKPYLCQAKTAFDLSAFRAAAVKHSVSAHLAEW